jgi:hypothetical protein
VGSSSELPAIFPHALGRFETVDTERAYAGSALFRRRSAAKYYVLAEMNLESRATRFLLLSQDEYRAAPQWLPRSIATEFGDIRNRQELVRAVGKLLAKIRSQAG